MKEAMIQVLPIIIFILIGKTLEIKKLMKYETAEQLKLGLIRIALPVILFLAFKNMDLDIRYLLVSVLTFVMLFLNMILGKLIVKLGYRNNLLPFFATSTAFGLLGIPLFENIYGIENLGAISVFGIGNEVFIWFFYITIFNYQFGKQKFSSKILIDFIKSPIIVAVILGLVTNYVGLERYLSGRTLYEGIIRTFEQVAALTSPLILIVIGYGISLEKKFIKEAAVLVGLRLLIVAIVGVSVKFLLFDRLFDVNMMFNRALFTYLILPPPFVLAIYTGFYRTKEETAVISTATVINVLVTVTLFILMVFIY